MRYGIGLRCELTSSKPAFNFWFWVEFLAFFVRGMRTSILLFSSFFANYAFASTLSLPNVNWNVAYTNMPLVEVLTEVLTPSGYSIIISPKVKATVSGRLTGSTERVFERLVSTYGLIWYFEQNILYVYAAGEAKSQLVRLQRADLAKVQRSLAQLGLNDRRFKLSYDDRNRTLMVSGPPRWVELVTSVALSADEVSSSTQAAEVRVFKLKHARATDRVFNGAAGEVVVPGVVSLLQQLFNLSVTGSNRRPAATGASEKSSRDSYAKVFKTLLSQSGKPASSPDSLGLTDNSDGQGASVVSNDLDDRGGRNSLPQIQADPRTNSVVIRDYVDRMAANAAAIETLDTPTRLIEIEAAILDVSSDALESFGIDWRLSSRRVDLQLGGGGGAPLSRTNDLTQALLGTVAPVGALGSLALGNGVNQLLSRLNALEEDGRGRVLSRPKIITPENMEATIDNTSTFYVRLQGNLEVSLANVTTGTSLRVLPSIEPGRNGPMVKLAIKIEDGSLSSTKVDNLPVVNRNSVTTEAVVNVGQTLLIGGLSVERDSDTVNGVPILRSLPVVGKLFQSTNKRRERVERIFMLTPRVIDVND